jgi:HEAT repeat protein
MKRIQKNVVCSILIMLLVSVAQADVQQSITELSDRDWQVRRAAAQSLGESGATGKTVVAALTTALQDADSRVRRSAADALGNIGEKARAAVPALVDAFDDIDPSVVAAAAADCAPAPRRCARARSSVCLAWRPGTSGK